MLSDQTLQKTILSNLNGEPQTRRAVRAATIGDFHVPELRLQFEAAFDHLAAVAWIVFAGGAWQSTRLAMEEM